MPPRLPQGGSALGRYGCTNRLLQQVTNQGPETRPTCSAEGQCRPESAADQHTGTCVEGREAKGGLCEVSLADAIN